MSIFSITVCLQGYMSIFSNTVVIQFVCIVLSLNKLNNTLNICTEQFTLTTINIWNLALELPD